MLFTVQVIYFMKLVQCNEYLVSTVDTDGLVQQHQGTNSHSMEYASLGSQLFVG